MSYYNPPRARKRWLEGAPEYVLACYDAGEKVGDRYTVLIGGSLAYDPKTNHNRRIQYLGMNGQPTHPAHGVSQWGEIESHHRTGMRGKCRWSDLPEHIQKHIISRCTE